MKRTLLAVLVLGIAPLLASAATITWTLQYAGSFNNTTDWTPIADQTPFFNAGLNPVGYNGTAIHAFNVYFQASGLSANQDIKQVGADLTMSGLTVAYPFTFNADECTVQVKKAPPATGYTSKQVAVFESAGDSGTPGDNLGLQAAMSAQVQYYNHLGEDAPLLLGTIYVSWDGKALANMNATGGPAGGTTWIVWENNSTRDPFGTVVTSMNPANGNPVVGQTVTFGAGVPEPMTMALMAIGGIGMLIRRRR